MIDLRAAIVSTEFPLRGTSAELRSVRVLRREFPAEAIAALDIIETLKGAVIDKATGRHCKTVRRASSNN